MIDRAMKSFVVILVVVGLPCTGWAGALDRGVPQQRYNQAADEMIRVPGVVGMWESDAMAVLQQAGVAPHIEYSKKYREDLTGREGTVIDQEPGAAGITMLGSTVTITVYWPASMGAEPGPEPGPELGIGESGGQPANDGGQWGEPTGAAPPPAYEKPAPQWGGGSQPATGNQPASGGGWVPPPVPDPQPYVTPAAAQPAAPPAIPAAPVQRTVTPVSRQRSSGPAPIAATPVQPTATQVAPQPVSPSPIPATPVQQTVTPVSRQRPSGPAPIAATPVQPTATQVAPQPAAPPAIPATLVQQTVTPVSRQRPSRSAPITGTLVQPTATQADQQPATPAPIVMTPVQPTATQTNQQPADPAPIVMTPVQPIATIANQPPAGPPTSGRVQIKVIRIEAVKDTGDPKKDGKKDEVLIAARGLWYLKNNKRVLKDIKFKSAVYGDTRDHPERIKTGSARSSGGIQSGDNVTTSLTIFDQVLGSSSELILFPTIWEVDGDNTYLDRFLNVSTDLPSSYRNFPERYWTHFSDPEVRLAPPEQEKGEYYSSVSFQQRYCANPWEKTDSPIGNVVWYSSNPAVPIGSLTNNYSIPMGSYAGKVRRSTKSHTKNYFRAWDLPGNKFSLNWSYVEKISKIDCGGYGPGVLKLHFSNGSSKDRNLGEYNMYLRFIVTPAPG